MSNLIPHQVLPHQIDEKKYCCKCGNKGMELINTCVTYDQYHLCLKCGHVCMCESSELSPEENRKRRRKILELISKVEGKGK